MKGYLIDKDIDIPDLAARLKSDAPAPEIEEGSTEVLVDVHSASLNFFDILQIQGKYQVKKPHPYVPGAEIAGVISKNSPIPEGCNFVPGVTRVFGQANGSYAEQVKAEHWALQEMPEGMSFEEASGLYVTWPTSYAALVFRAKVQKDEWVLVHAGAGGVGLCAIMIAKALGAKVIATAGSEDKLEVCKTVGGADYAINYRNKEWAQEVKKITQGHGADVVYDPVGMLVPSLKCIAWNGRLLVIGFAGGQIEKVPANLLLLKQATVMGLFWGAHVFNEPERIPEAFEGFLGMIKDGKAKPTVYEHVYDGLDQLPQALTDLRDRKTWGKAVVRIRADPKHPPKASSKL